MAISRRGGGFVALAMLALLGACAAPVLPEVGPEASMFTRDTVAPENRMPLRVALAVPPQVLDKTVEVPDRFRVQAGQIVERALLAALGDGLQRGVQQVNVPPPASAQFDATLVIQEVHFDSNIRAIFSSFHIFCNDLEASTRLGFDVSLFDAQGHRVWTRSYDDGSGRFVWCSPTSGPDAPKNGFAHLANEAAWRLSQQVLSDLREWLAEERMKARQL